MNIVYQKLRDNAIIPTKATEMSGGWDVYASHIEQVSPNKVIVYLGLAMQPVSKETRKAGMNFNSRSHVIKTVTNYRLRFSPRSSFTKYNWILQNSPALGDADYPGEYMLVFRAIPTGAKITHLDEDWEGDVFGGVNVRDSELELAYDKFPYKVGDRIAQMWVEEDLETNLIEGKLPNKTDRTGGFGSTNTEAEDSSLLYGLDNQQ